ncbi:MAG: hypothetical protein AB1540_03910 [Bdellovibrionota bacterium]
MIGFWIALWIWLSPLAHAAPCCSGTAVVPSLITSDASLQVSTRISQSGVVGNSREDGSSVFNREGNDESVTRVAVDLSYALDPRWQLHSGVPLNRRYRAIDARKSANWGIADLSLGAAFEAIEELSYHQVFPRTWIFADLIVPAGRAPDQSSDLLRSDVHGRGAWGGALGFFSQKSFKGFDAYLLGTHQRYLPQGSFSFGSVFLGDIGLGYNPGQFRFGVSIGPQWEGTDSDPNGLTSQRSKLVWTSGVSMGASFQDAWSLVGSYADQTLFGPTYNSQLSRTFMITAMHRINK